MEVQAAYAFIQALFLAMALIPLLMRAAGPLGLNDRGGGRKVHVGVIPRTGGVAIFVGFLVPVLLGVPLRPDLEAFVTASVVLFIFGVLDDRFDLDYRLKFFGQMLAALIVTLYGGVLIEQVPFFPDSTLPKVLAVPLTLFVVIGVTNALNLSDGLDGLAGGISLLAVGCLLLLAYGRGDGSVVVVSGAVMGAIFGFLRFNSFPARIFMGDSGSQFLGFSVVVLALIVTQHSDLALSPAIPILIFGLPVLDTLKVMSGRISRGNSPFKADRTHFHHRLLASGLSQYEVVSLIYGVQFLLVVLAYLLRYSFDSSILISYGVFCVVILFAVTRLESAQGYLKNRDDDKTVFARLIAKARKTRFITKVPVFLLRVAIPLVLVLGALMASNVTRDIGLLAAVLFSSSMLAALISAEPFFVVERLTAYTLAVTVTYLVEGSQGLMDVCGLCVHLLFAILALSTVFWVRFSSTHFKVSTLDVLILFGALVAPSLHGLHKLGIVVLESIVLFYGIEVLIQERKRFWDPLRIGCIVALAILTVKGLLI